MLYSRSLFHGGHQNRVALYVGDNAADNCGAKVSIFQLLLLITSEAPCRDEPTPLQIVQQGAHFLGETEPLGLSVDIQRLHAQLRCLQPFAHDVAQSDTDWVQRNRDQGRYESLPVATQLVSVHHG